MTVPSNVQQNSCITELTLSVSQAQSCRMQAGAEYADAHHITLFSSHVSLCQSQSQSIHWSIAFSCRHLHHNNQVLSVVSSPLEGSRFLEKLIDKLLQQTHTHTHTHTHSPPHSNVTTL